MEITEVTEIPRVVRGKGANEQTLELVAYLKGMKVTEIGSVVGEDETACKRYAGRVRTAVKYVEPEGLTFEVKTRGLSTYFVRTA